MRAVFLAAWIAGMTVASSAQDQTAPPPALPSVIEPRFEVASVKKSAPSPVPMGGRFGLQPGGRFTMNGLPVSSLVTIAYGIQRYQLIGGPGWIHSDRFDINAIAEDVPVQPPVPGTPNRMQLLLRSLLKERFALVVHNEQREMPLSYLVMAREDRRLGERLRPSTVDCKALLANRGRDGAPPFQPPKPGETPQCGMMAGFGLRGRSVAQHRASGATRTEAGGDTRACRRSRD